MPETATASSDKFVFPTNCTPRWRAIAKHFASRFAGEPCLARHSEPPVVTTPSMSIKSFTASRHFLLSFDGGQYSMKALSRVELSGRAFGIAQPQSQVTTKIAGTIVRITADLNIAIRKHRLNNPNMVRTKEYGGKRANEGIGSVAN